MANQATRDGNDVWLDIGNGFHTVVDEADYWKISGRTWRALHTSRSRPDQFYVVTSGPKYLHRVIMDAPKGVYIDHIDGNPLNNRRANLRLCSNQENNAHRNGAYKTSKSGMRGVSHAHIPYTRKNTSGTEDYWVFRCHNVTCKACKYFPFTDDGLAEAKAFATAHYAAIPRL